MWHKFVAFSCPQPHACASTDTGPDRLGQGKMRPPDAAERQCALQNPITALPAKPGGTPFSRKPKLLRTLFCGIRTWAPSMWDSAVPANSAKLRHAAAARHRMLTRQARGPASKIAASIRRLSACGCARFTPPSLAAWQQREDRWALATSAATPASMTRCQTLLSVVPTAVCAAGVAVLRGPVLRRPALVLALPRGLARHRHRGAHVKAQARRIPRPRRLPLAACSGAGAECHCTCAGACAGT